MTDTAHGGDAGRGPPGEADRHCMVDGQDEHVYTNERGRTGSFASALSIGRIQVPGSHSHCTVVTLVTRLVETCHWQTRLGGLTVSREPPLA